MKKIGLVLEGGAMRGIYSAGVLDFFMKKRIYIPYIVGVSAGACHALSYISRQYGRNKDIARLYANDKRYLSYRNLIKTGSIFGFEFIFDKIANELLPFNFKIFENSKQELAVGVTNCITGKAEFFYKSKMNTDNLFKATIASSSLPLVSNEVFIKGVPYFDGGLSCPIPIHQAIKDGCEKNIIVLTRNIDYRKKPAKTMSLIAKKKYTNYNGLIDAIENRHVLYNETLDFLNELEKQGKAIIIRPIKPIKVKRMDRNKSKIKDLYREGYIEAGQRYNEIIDFISR